MKTESQRRIVVVDSYFDGERHQLSGPFTLLLAAGKIQEILPGDATASGEDLPTEFREADDAVVRAAFALPGLVEGHSHLFLDGAELDFKKRQAHLKAPRAEMLDLARRNARAALDAGITLIRDGGDAYGINTRLRAELRQSDEVAPEYRSPGLAIRKQKRYGSFMAREVTDAASIVATIAELAPEADDLKVLLTGIIDFEKGAVKGKPQFDLEEARLIVKTAKTHGLLTYAHCSGREGLEIAAEAGIDSVEHGFFMTRRILQVMADKGIAWTPTFSPVHFQWSHPELAPWDEDTVRKLRQILDRHQEHIRMVAEMGVEVIAGSDAGSYGVPHGAGLLDELVLLAQAGLTTTAVLQAATTTPRRLWGCAPAAIRTGNRVNITLLAASPFAGIENLRRVEAVIMGERMRVVSGHRTALEPESVIADSSLVKGECRG